ncbi:MAG: N-acetyltransferase [Patescibacteria group bacterium]|nr:GNAT family N-acetyltransferase [Patescibacteria group bacterium]
MKIFTDNKVAIHELELLFTACFLDLVEQDEEKFDENNGQSLREWFGIDELRDYLKHSRIIVAEEDGKLVGAAIVGKQNPLTWPDGKKCEVFNLGVLPEHRNKGLGSDLMEAVEKEAKLMGAKSIVLNVHELMTETQKFYEKLGYKRTGILRYYYENGSAVFFMKKLS